MDGGFITIIIVVAVLAASIGLFLFGDWMAKRGAKSGAAKPAAKDASKDAPKPPEPVKAAPIVNNSNLADDIVSMLPKPEVKKDDKKSASERSYLGSRRDRMIAFYDRKYKAKSEAFSSSFEESLGDNSSMVVDGVEITKEDVKKLTALHGLFERKSADG